jgi:nicotinamide-nucleotide amidase
MEVSVGILAIGNEVVEGQITNRNAAWLSQELTKIGAQPLYHLSCRDHKKEIPQALDFLEKHCQLIIVCGGLGPTKDDFTRTSIGDWAEKKLILNEEAWVTIKQNLESRNLTLREGHKNQAYLPEDSKILLNDVGVAPGFFLKTKNIFIASLPGPPNELEAMYNLYLKPLIIENLKPKSDLKLYTWICFGAPESEVAHVAESIIGDKYELGFRLIKPYVEVKVWAPLKINSQETKLFELLEEKLKPWYVAHDIQSIRKKFHDQLKKYSKIFVIDHISNGLFLMKLHEYQNSSHIRYQSFESENFRFFQKSEILSIHKSMPVSSDQLIISLFPASESSAYISFNEDCRLFEVPRKISLKTNTGQHFILENCFLYFGENG